MTEVKVDKLTKSYEKGVKVLDSLELTVKAGEFFFLLGPSGCGKTTLLRILAGLLESDSGRIFFNDEDVTKWAPEKRRSSMVFQNYALWPHLSVFENVAFGLRAIKTPERIVKEKVGEALKLVRLNELSERKVPSLSGGQQQRIALARALAVDPRIILLDEPLSNLDARLRDEMRVEIRRICKERKLTALYVTHDRAEALSMGDRIALLDKGQVAQSGTPEELYYHPRSRFAADFLGDMNYLEGTQLESNWTDTLLGPLRLSPECALPARRATLFFRPEAVEFAETAEKDNNVFPGRVIAQTFLGERIEYLIQSELPDPVRIYQAGPPKRRTGEEIFWRIAPEKIGVLTE